MYSATEVGKLPVKVKDLISAPGFGSYFYEDIQALQSASLPPSRRYRTPAKHAEMQFVREPAEVLSLGLVLEDGFVAWGDCVGVSYGGKSGRDPLLRAEKIGHWVNDELKPLLVGHEVPPINYKGNFPKAVAYGLSQALLRAHAHAQAKLPVSILCAHWNLPLPTEAVLLHGSCGEDRNANVDKLLSFGIGSLPASQGDDIACFPGTRGENLIAYLGWLKERVRYFGGETYKPTFHFDLHGALGKIFPDSQSALEDYLGNLYQAALPYRLRLESPIIEVSRTEQVLAYERLKKTGIPIEWVVDEWANTLDDIRAFVGCADMIHIKMPDMGSLTESMEAVRLCQSHNVQSLLGGSCIETVGSSELSVHVALASRPDLLLIKPGMGISEGFSIISLEMQRVLANLRNSASRQPNALR